MEERKDLKRWIEEHKKELIIGSIIVIGGIGCTINGNAFKKLFEKVEPNVRRTVEEIPSVIQVTISPITEAILENLTGNMLTARELGNKVGYSAQVINKRLIEAGLITKTSYGDYILTESGRLLGKDTWKTTGAGHSFSNIEWDEIVLEIILTPEEVLKISK